MSFLAVMFFLMFSPPSAVSAQTLTPTNSEQPLFPTRTPVPEGLYDCPALPPNGYGTVTPSAKWNLLCGHCSFNPVPTLDTTPTPQATPSPTGGWYIKYIGSIDIYDVDNSSYWGQTQYQQFDIGYVGHEMVFALEPIFPREPLFQTVVTGVSHYDNNSMINRIKLSGNVNIYFNDIVKSEIANDLLERTGKNSGFSAGGHSLGLSTSVLQVSYVARDEWHRLNSLGFRLHLYVLNQVEPYPEQREYVVTHNTEIKSGKVMLSCSQGDRPLGAFVGVAVQGGGIVATQVAYTRLVDTGYAPLMLASVNCNDFSCSGSDYEVSQALQAQYPYARLSQAVIPSSVIAEWSRSDTLNGVHNINLHCYGTGSGYVTNLESYCSVIDALDEPIDFGLNPVYQDRGCVSVEPIVVGDFSTPGFNICARVITFGELNLFGLVINLDLIARFMMVVAALYLVLR